MSRPGSRDALIMGNSFSASANAASNVDTNPRHGSGSSNARRNTGSTNCAYRHSITATSNSSLLGNRRYSVATPTPARRAISSSGTSVPASVKAAQAAAMIRSALRAASARSGLAAGASIPAR